MFQSTQASGSRTLPRRTDSLASQQKSPASQTLLTVEDELRDAKRVLSHGLEEDLRQALQMVINRVEGLVSAIVTIYHIIDQHRTLSLHFSRRLTKPKQNLKHLLTLPNLISN